MLKLNLKLLPILATIRFIVFVNALFSASLILFVYVYFASNWGMNFDDITAIYLKYFMTSNILLLLIIKFLYLNPIKYATTSFLTEYLVSGILPSRLLQSTKSSQIFKRIFKSNKILRKNYRTTKKAVCKEKPLLTIFSFKHAFISYCTARNDEDCSKSARYFMLFLQAYSSRFFWTKIRFNITRLFFLLICVAIFAIGVSAVTPNYLNIPHYTSLHFISGGIIGYALYKIVVSHSILNREIIWTLRFLQDKTLPISLKLKG